jgi:HSP20 family protein
MAEKQSAVETTQPSQSQQAGQGNQEERENQRRPERQTPQQRGMSQQGKGREGRIVRGDQAFLLSPFSLLQRLADGVTGVFEDVSLARNEQSSPAMSLASATGLWAPDIDVIQRGNELVIRADLPGLTADDVVVEVGDDAITISGERERQHEEERGGVYRVERIYGRFLRTIPLPPGAMADQATATFSNGVLEITVPSPPEQVSRGRRLEIAQGNESRK